MVQIVRASVSGSIPFAAASCHLVVRVFSFIRMFQFEKKMWRVTHAAAPSVVHHCVGVFCAWLPCNAARCFVGVSVRRVPVFFPLICYVIGRRWSMHAAYALETSVVPQERPSCDGGIGDAISRRWIVYCTNASHDARLPRHVCGAVL